MILSLLISTALMPVTYNLPLDKPTFYDLKIGLEGYIPILGGQDGTVNVTLAVKSQGLAPDVDSNPQATLELDTLKVLFNGAALPVSAENARAYFPKSTVSITRQGRVVKNNAAPSNSPIKLPGLDSKRFPELSIVPIEFPTEGVEIGTTWSYKKPFGTSDLTTTCKVLGVTDDSMNVEMKVHQEFDGFEDESHNLVLDKKSAAYSLHTVADGGGTAVFDRKSSLISKMNLVVAANTDVKDLTSNSTSQRKMTTTLNSSLRQGLAPAAKTASREPNGSMLDTAAGYGQLALVYAKHAWSGASDQVVRVVMSLLSRLGW